MSLRDTRKDTRFKTHKVAILLSCVPEGRSASSPLSHVFQYVALQDVVCKRAIKLNSLPTLWPGDCLPGFMQQSP